MTDVTVLADPNAVVPEADKILAILSLIENGESERGACEHIGMNRATFRSRALKMGAADHYARATSALASFQVEQFESIIEKAERGEIDPQTARVVMDGRKWIASKLFPRQWGDKVAVTGGDPAVGDKPIQVIDVTGLSPEQLSVLAGLNIGGE